MRVAIIIPAFNHAAFVVDAVRSALAQTHEDVDVIVVDDGSADDPCAALEAVIRDARVIVRRIPHAGVAAARNFGLGLALARGAEFVQFLDADDVLDSRKIAQQLEAFHDEVGFVLCDVEIVDVNGKRQLASDRYGYSRRELGGWIAPQLEVANFIPVHAPLIRASAIGDLRFPLDEAREDWHFMYGLAQRARCTYLRKVLATYRKRPGGRNSTRPVKHRRPGAVDPLRLNLGCGNPKAASWHPMPGFVNLDASLGWKFEDGLRDFADGSVAGVTISHSLMYVAAKDWPAAIAEVARVLEPGGVVRITEDDTANPASRTYPRGWRDAVTLTSPAQTRAALEAAGLTVHDLAPSATKFRDPSLIQQQHGEPPHVFFVEGVRDRALLLTPHADDEALFASFLILRYRPHVVVCFPSTGDYGDTATRLEESRAAVSILGGGPVEQLAGVDPETTAAQLCEKFRALDARIRPLRVFAPSDDTSHPDHAAVALAAVAVFGDRLTRFQTYNFRGAIEGVAAKVRRGEPVPFDAGWHAKKIAALACYKTQLAHPRARQFFAWDSAEYTARD